MIDTELTDAELIAAYCGGRADAFDMLVERYKRPLFAWLCNQVSSTHDADDLFQETWIRVAKSASRFKDVSFKAWLWRIARNQVIDGYRRRKPTVSLDMALSDDEDSPSMKDLIPDTTPQPSEHLVAMESAETARRIISELPEMQREVLTLRMQAGLTFAQIAQTLDIPLSTALGRMHDAVEKIRKALTKEALS